MVLLEVDPKSVASVELERNAPWSVDVDRVADGDETFQTMEFEPGKIHLLRRARRIQSIEADKDALV